MLAILKENNGAEKEVEVGDPPPKYHYEDNRFGGNEFDPSILPDHAHGLRYAYILDFQSGGYAFYHFYQVQGRPAPVK